MFRFYKVIDCLGVVKKKFDFSLFLSFSMSMFLYFIIYYFCSFYRFFTNSNVFNIFGAVNFIFCIVILLFYIFYFIFYVFKLGHVLLFFVLLFFIFFLFFMSLEKIFEFWLWIEVEKNDLCCYDISLFEEFFFLVVSRIWSNSELYVLYDLKLLEFLAYKKVQHPELIFVIDTLEFSLLDKQQILLKSNDVSAINYNLELLFYNKLYFDYYEELVLKAMECTTIFVIFSLILEIHDYLFA